MRTSLYAPRTCRSFPRTVISLCQGKTCLNDIGIDTLLLLFEFIDRELFQLLALCYKGVRCLC